MALADFCVLTPLDEEWQAVQNIISPPPPIRREVTRDPMVYYLWTKNWSHRAENKAYLLVASALGRMGQTSAASITFSAIHHWNPAHIILLGIAGGFEPPEQRLGDVIVSTDIVGYALDDITGPEETRTFRPTGSRAGATWLNQVRALKANTAEFTAWQQACMQAAEPEPKLPKDLKPPSIHFGITASGNTVAKSTIFAKRLIESLNRKIMGVEMEADGVFEAVWGSGTGADVLMIRGISDFADDNKGRLDGETKGAWRKWAAGNTGRLFSALLERHPVQNLVSPPLTLDLTSDTDRSVLLQDGVFLAGKGCNNLAFPKLIARAVPTPEVNLTLLGLTASGIEVMPERSLCTVSYADGRRTLYPSMPGNKSRFILPRVEEEIVVRVSLAFKKGKEKLQCIKVEAVDEYGRKCSGVMEE